MPTVSIKGNNMSKKKSGDIKKVIGSIIKKHGKDSIQHGNTSFVKNIEYIPTGSPALDAAIGIGGIPRGRIIELYGPESAGKTTLALSIVANAQKNGHAAFIDAEHALDPIHAKRLGVDMKNLILSQPNSGEEALSIAKMMTDSGEIDLIVIDSVAALVPQAELDGDIADHNIGAQARMMSKAMRQLAASANVSGTSIIFINQIREKIGVLFGSPETTPGGRALKFYASLRMEIRRVSSSQIKEGEGKNQKIVGMRSKVTCKKNKVAPPFKSAEITLRWDPEGITYGIDTIADLVVAAASLNLFQISGSWYSFNNERVGNGKENVILMLRENSDLAEQINKAVIDASKPNIAELSVEIDDKEAENILNNDDD